MNQRINSFVVVSSSKQDRNIGSEARKPTGIRNEQWNYSVAIGWCQELCAKLILVSGRNLLQGAADRPLVTIQRAGRKGSRAAVRRSSCP